jgi:hypothetical protein
MNLVDQYPDLPSPTNRDSAASAIFNLYGYQNRDSLQAEEKGEVSRSSVPNGSGYRYTEELGEDAEDALVEELQSPRIAEPQPRAGETDLTPPTSGNDMRTSRSNGHSATTSRPKSMALAPSLPVSSQASNRRHSSAVSMEPFEDAQSRIRNTPQDGRSTIIEEEQSAFLTVPSDAPQRAIDQESSLTGRQRGEEEDAYHVRSTCEYFILDLEQQLKRTLQTPDSRYKAYTVMDGTRESSEREGARSRMIGGVVRYCLPRARLCLSRKERLSEKWIGMLRS